METLSTHWDERTVNFSGSKYSIGIQCFPLKKGIQTKYRLMELH
jgi:hypothetical protein